MLLLFHASHCGLMFIHFWLCFYIYIGMSSTMNLSFGSLEKKETNTSDTQPGRYMQSRRLWPLTFPLTSMYTFFIQYLIWQLRNTFEWQIKVLNYILSLRRLIVLQTLLEAKYLLFLWFDWSEKLFREKLKCYQIWNQKISLTCGRLKYYIEHFYDSMWDS
jgi:hypothetical protein